MKLGDFFTSATTAKPVNPRPVTLRANARGAILPGGAPNPGKSPVGATLTGALVLLGGDESAALNVTARATLRERFPDKELDESDFDVELTYHVMQKCLREWDEASKTTGDPLFPNVDTARELVLVREAVRVVKLYNVYVADEHPEVVPPATFRGAEARGKSLARG